MAEAGYPDIEGENWFGVLAPAGTPKAIIARLHREIANIVAQPTSKERLAASDLEPVVSRPEEFSAQIKSELAKWAAFIRAAGIKAE